MLTAETVGPCSQFLLNFALPFLLYRYGQLYFSLLTNSKQEKTFCLTNSLRFFRVQKKISAMTWMNLLYTYMLIRKNPLNRMPIIANVALSKKRNTEFLF